ncbi:MAG: hypothetical protein WCI73_00410 [Phycisphaerae bacterium]
MVFEWKSSTKANPALNNQYDNPNATEITGASEDEWLPMTAGGG